MKKAALFSCFALACQSQDPDSPDNGAPTVSQESTYSFVTEVDIPYAEGLAHDEASTTPFSVPLLLDLYLPDTDSSNRPLFMWIHGGGFTGGTTTNPEIVALAEYYASRGWVFASIDYRTTEDLCDSEKFPECKDKIRDMGEEDVDNVAEFYRGIVPVEWTLHALDLKPDSVKKLQQSFAQYTAQRDAKAALRWLVANADTYGINTDYITVGGNSAGALTTTALGISNLDDFRDEISLADDPTLSTTHLEQSYTVQGIVLFWGSNDKLDLFESVYDLEQYDRYDAGDPELFMGHGKAEDLQTPYSGALELQSVYNDLGVYNQLATLYLPDGSDAGHSAWDGEADGKGLVELTFDFVVERQGLNLQ